MQLDGGKFVDFSLKKRPDDKYFSAVFMAPTGKRLEKATGESKKGNAAEVAAQLIKDEYTPKTTASANVGWDEAIRAMEREMMANNNRPRTLQDYKETLAVLRHEFPDASGPGAITEAMAKLFKVRRAEACPSSHSVTSDLKTLRSIWGKWFIRVCGLLTTNPWKSVDLPKTDEVEKRYISVPEEQAFFAWLSKTWNGWRLPVLFFQLKGLLGCRILQLSSVESADLRDGRLYLVSETAKGRRVRGPKLPEAIYVELKTLAGKTYLWERYSEQLGRIHRSRGRRAYVEAFAPKRLKSWLQRQVKNFCKKHAEQPGFRAFTAHDFRGTAMSEAINSGASVDEAATAFLCHPATIKAHYLVQERSEVEDRTLERVFKARLAVETTAPAAKAE